MTDLCDGELLTAFRNGDSAAFTAIVMRHQSSLLRHARAILGSGSAYEDVVQEVFLKLAQQPPVLTAGDAGDGRQGTVQLLSWLHKVTRNSCMDVLRSETRRRHREQDVAAEESADGGIATVEGEDTRAAVEREISKLPVDQREVLVLRLLGERSYREIADITGKKVGTVGWLVSVGLKALGEKLAPILSGEASSSIAGPVPQTGLGGSQLGFAQGELS